MITTFILVGGCLQPVDLITWSQWIDEPYNDHVRTDFVEDVRITTLFRGVDLNPHGTPQFFECGVIMDEQVVEIERTATLSDAERRHAAVVDHWRKRLAVGCRAPERPEVIADIIAVAVASPHDFRYPPSEKRP